MTIGQWIRAERESRQWSQDQLAFRAHVSPRLIGRYERGEGAPSQENLARIAEAMEIVLPWTSTGVATPEYLSRTVWPLSASTEALALSGG